MLEFKLQCLDKCFSAELLAKQCSSDSNTLIPHNYYMMKVITLQLFEFQTECATLFLIADKIGSDMFIN